MKVPVGMGISNDGTEFIRNKGTKIPVGRMLVCRHTCWKDLNKKAASGVDKVTAQAYEEDLEANSHSRLDTTSHIKNRSSISS
ncbi:MAG: hypothetical protein KAQ72_11990 [Desulfobacula sp.]|nr:hypothetical protein [Desulfobacula sp.]